MLQCPLTGQRLDFRSDRLERPDGAFYPVRDGIPILMGPELQSGDAPPASGIYAEAYAEQAFYDTEAERVLAALRSDGIDGLHTEEAPLIERLRQGLDQDFPNRHWLTAKMDLGAEWDCYRHLGRINGRHTLQLGGKGVLSMCFLLAGARKATLVTPMLAEARIARECAVQLGVADRFEAIVGIAEQMPLPDATVDAIYSGGCVHHMTTEFAFREVSRVLSPGGRFAAAEPWKAPLYTLGTKIFGKREANPFCRPLSRERVAPLAEAFSECQYIQHGALTRYPLLALGKFLPLPQAVVAAIGRVDDALCSCIGLRRFGSSVALLAVKH